MHNLLRNHTIQLNSLDFVFRFPSKIEVVADVILLVLSSMNVINLCLNPENGHLVLLFSLALYRVWIFSPEISVSPLMGIFCVLPQMQSKDL